MSKGQGRKKGTLWMALGLLLLAAALSLTLYNIWDAARADQSAQSVAAELEQAITDRVTARQAAEAAGESTVSDPLDPDREMPTVEIDGNLYIGELEVPDLGLTLPVMSDWDYSKLKISPCRYSGSYYAGNLVIAGHNYARHFSALKWVPLGTEVLFTNVDGEVFRYTVVSLETLQPSQVEEMTADSDSWDLTLFTCNTGGGTRCAVRCQLVEE